MELWQIYKHCQTSKHLESLVVDAMRLRGAAESTLSEHSALFEPIEQMMDPPPVRLAADPTAMAAACSLHAARTATDRGWYDLAIVLYRSIIQTAPDASPTYYVKRAKVGLEEALSRKAALAPKIPLSSLAAPALGRP